MNISFDITDEEGVIAFFPHPIGKDGTMYFRNVELPAKMVVWANDEDVNYDTWEDVEQGLRRQFSTAMEAPDEDGKVYWIDADEVFYSEYEPDYRDGEGFSNVEEYIEWYKEQIKDSEVDRDSSYGGAIVNITKEGTLGEVELGSLQFFEVEDDEEEEKWDVEAIEEYAGTLMENAIDNYDGDPADIDTDGIYDDVMYLFRRWISGEGRDEYDDPTDFIDAHIDTDDYIPNNEEDDE